MQKSDLENIINNNEWDFGNQILYDLCKNYPAHKVTYEVLAKIFFIGRIYAAAIERRKNKRKNENGDDFYMNKVVPKMIDSKIDEKLKFLDQYKRIDENNYLIVLETHKYLSELFNELAKLDKRSLSSKYLHFHKPKLFFIYDSRVSTAFSNCLPRYQISKSDKENINEMKVDETYAKFLIKSLKLRKIFEDILEKKLFQENTIRFSYILPIRNKRIILINGYNQQAHDHKARLTVMSKN